MENETQQKSALQPPPLQAQGSELQQLPHGAAAPLPLEIGGPAGPEPTRYGDWELRGRCIDF